MTSSFNNSIKKPIVSSLKKAVWLMGFSLFYPAFAFSQNVAADVEEIVVRNDSVSATEVEAIFENRQKSLSESHFTWGAEFGTSIDVSGYDSSTFNVDVVIGYKSNYFRMLGVSVGVHRAFGTGDNFIPISAVVRTSFSSRPRLFFMSLKAGYSFNTISDSPTFGDINATLGCGINLAISRHFKSHLILGYEFRHFNKKHREMYSIVAKDISLATLTFGANF